MVLQERQFRNQAVATDLSKVSDIEQEIIEIRQLLDENSETEAMQ
jgi:hypothetical protein